MITLQTLQIRTHSSVRTLEEVRSGEELTIHYMMDMEEAPEWYQLCWDKHYQTDE